MENTLKITSTFEENTLIPKMHSCEWKNTNPEIMIGNIPEKTESLALIMDDPDAPMWTFVHWVAWNMPVGDIEESSSGSWMYKEGINSASKKGYTWPCPPVWHWLHHYHFRIFALDHKLNLDWEISKERLLKEIGPHVIAQWDIIWLFERK
ncbi:MAG: hypothetical protein ACD_2C00092G0005 [uncultured bacterium (gcode 4)]|uniref:Phospholipid-binding protein n=1 Tax=uncultured bacterium (gcode 4) TaxID=1234023 RepID=K2G680_9BACT|nr:MAG: hypothetical protein ACD_2C00092G0005 [uncultured bacterium (gcode 4)]